MSNNIPEKVQEILKDIGAPGLVEKARQLYKQATTDGERLITFIQFVHWMNSQHEQVRYNERKYTIKEMGRENLGRCYNRYHYMAIFNQKPSDALVEQIRKEYGGIDITRPPQELGEGVWTMKFTTTVDSSD